MCHPGPHELKTRLGRPLAELPLSVASIGFGPLRKRMCYSGGGYLRLLPLALIRQGLELEAKAARASVVYLHPREFAPEAPRLALPLHRRFKCYVGLHSTERKLRNLLQNYRWGSCLQVLETTLGRAFNQSRETGTTSSAEAPIPVSVSVEPAF